MSNDKSSKTIPVPVFVLAFRLVRDKERILGGVGTMTVDALGGDPPKKAGAIPVFYTEQAAKDFLKKSRVSAPIHDIPTHRDLVKILEQARRELVTLVVINPEDVNRPAEGMPLDKYLAAAKKAKPKAKARGSR